MARAGDVVDEEAGGEVVACDGAGGRGVDLGVGVLSFRFEFTLGRNFIEAIAACRGEEGGASGLLVAAIGVCLGKSGYIMCMGVGDVMG